MSAMHDFHDDHLLDALAAGLNAEVYEALVHEGAESMSLDAVDRKAILDAATRSMEESAEWKECRGE